MITTILIAGVNSFAERYRVGSSDPSSSNDAGDLAFNTSSNVLKYYDGSAWQTIAVGSAGAVLQIIGGVPTWVTTPDITGPTITLN